MKKALFTILFAITFFANHEANGQSFVDKQNSVSVGYGVGTFIGAYSAAFEDYTDYSFSGIGPLYLKYEKAISDKVGLGINVAYAGYKFEWLESYDVYNSTTGDYETRNYNYESKFTTYSVLARINWHFGEIEKFDPYFGIGLGLRGGKWEYSDNDPDSDSEAELKNVVPFGFETTIGARYFFTDNIGAYAEVGFAKSVSQFGLVFKF